MNGNGGVDRIAALTENLKTRLNGARVGGCHHGTLVPDTGRRRLFCLFQRGSVRDRFRTGLRAAGCQCNQAGCWNKHGGRFHQDSSSVPPVSAASVIALLTG